MTSFFRDPEAFQVLEQRVIPELVERNGGEAPVRVWVPGCATGEEAYSIAMLLIERFTEPSRRRTSRSSPATSTKTRSRFARAGIYPDTSPATCRPSGCGGFSPRPTITATRSTNGCVNRSFSPLKT